MLHYCKSCGAVTSSPLVAQIIDMKETKINELTHELIALTLKMKIAEDMLKEVGAYLNNEQFFKADRSTTGPPELIPTHAKALAHRVGITLKELKK